MLNLPVSVVLEYKPYGVETLTALREDTYKGRPVLVGIVLDGYEISRLGGHSLRRDTAGTPRTVYGITQEELDDGRIVRIAM